MHAKDVTQYLRGIQCRIYSKRIEFCNLTLRWRYNNWYVDKDSAERVVGIR